MKSKSSALHSCVETADIDLEDLEETADLPALFFTGDNQGSSNDDAGLSAWDQAQQSARFIEIGESINRNLERIASALESLPSDLSKHMEKPKPAARSVTNRKKKASKKTATS